MLLKYGLGLLAYAMMVPLMALNSKLTGTILVIPYLVFHYLIDKRKKKK